MEYHAASLMFKSRKVARYARLYGPRKTWTKVKGDRHYRSNESAAYAIWPARTSPQDDRARVGVLGCGKFAYTTIGYYLKKNYGLAIRGAMDTHAARASSFAQEYGASYFTDDPARVLDDDRIDLVYIASNHASHAEYAIAALDRGKSVHVEKPHVVDRDQLQRLCATMQRADGRVALGFNRPDSLLGRRAREYYRAEDGPGMMNWFVAGHEIAPDHWYFDEREGGRVLGNLCHWTDFVYRMVEPEARYPVRIVPVRWEKSDCDIVVSYVFADGTIAAITFSAKGHAFEGVRERFAGHRGNTLMALSDFRSLTVDRGADRTRLVRPFRDHGHENRITTSYGMRPFGSGESKLPAVRYVWETADLFLGTKEALEEQREVVLTGFPAGQFSAGSERALGC